VESDLPKEIDVLHAADPTEELLRPRFLTGDQSAKPPYGGRVDAECSRHVDQRLALNEPFQRFLALVLV
jgi:hypothetical protein